MSFNELLKVRVEARLDGNKIAELKLDDLEFIWNHPSISLGGNYENGQKGVIVEMFGWPYE